MTMTSLFYDFDDFYIVIHFCLFQFEGKKSVLFLCRDNYMRSPMIKSMFNELLEQTNQTKEWIVESAAIGWWDVGKGMDPRAKARCELYGLNTTHVVREISDDDFYKFDYIIATDETDFSFLKLQRPEDASAKIALLSSFSKVKFESADLPDPFFLKSKALLDALDDIIHRGWWYLVGFLDTYGIKVPMTTTIEVRTVKTSTKNKTSTVNMYQGRMASMFESAKGTKFKDRVTVKSTHRKLHKK